MKKINILVIIFLMCFTSSCEDMNDIIKDYLDEGEQIYIGIADSLEVKPGNLRATFRWKLDADPKLKETIIVWGETEAQTKVIPIDRTVSGAFWMEHTIENLPEGNNLFTIYNKDIYGNTSLKREKSGVIYGPEYIAGLSHRNISEMTVSGSTGELAMKWNTMDYCVGVNMRYPNQSGEMIDLFIKPTQTEVLIADFMVGGEFSYETLYKPSDDCIDVFSTQKKVMTFPSVVELDRSMWSATASSDADGSKASHVLDNDFNTTWHNQWQPLAPMPHWLLIDMKQEYDVTEVVIYKANNNWYLKKAIVELGLSETELATMGTVEFTKTEVPNSKSTIVDTPVRARYMKVLMTEAWDAGNATLSEIKVLGKVAK